MKTSPPNTDDLFHQAVEIDDPARRAAFLDAACGADASLRQEIEALLQHDQEGASFLESPPAGILDIETSPPSSSEFPGTTIGRYKLLEQIGEGGMGVVFVAEQIEPVRRRVALKIIKPGMDSKQVIARFEAERQALAMMDHPNIARIFDAGTIGAIKDERSGIRDDADDVPSLISHPSSLIAAPRPFFVMELVRGLPITEYCDKARLSPPQRLELFIDVCQAVQHAHQKGIIHRDLKPSNVMVTVHDGRPLVKVIDFGVAKAVGQQLTERTVYTAHAQLVGTPVYMSPEQADLSSQDVDTRSDVYSLGVLLYELLTGQTPFDKETLHKAGFDEMRRIIREEEPETVSNRIARTRRVGSAHHSADLSPSSLDLRPFAELDWIVMKALEKAPSRRYESASALAADIQRYLNDEPVLACPPTTMYRFQKFAKKHKPALATAAAVAACLLLGTTVSAWQAVRATTAEAKAEANELQANASAERAKEKAFEATTQRDEAQRQRDEVKALADKLAAKEDELQRTLYAAHMNLAQRAWEESAVPEVRGLLNQHRPQSDQPDLRGFEWHYLRRLTNEDTSPTIRTSIGSSTTGVVSLGGTAFSADGKRLLNFYGQRFNPAVATPRRDAELSICDGISGKVIQIFTLQGAGRTAVFSADARRLASTSDIEKVTKVWETESGKELFSVPCGGTNPIGRQIVNFNRDGRATLSFSRDGKRLYCLDEAGIKVWDAQTGQALHTLHGAWLPADFSRDGKLLVASGGTWDDAKKAWSDWKWKTWNAETGQELFAFEGDWSSLAFSPDSKRLLAIGSQWDEKQQKYRPGRIKVCDANTGQEIETIQEPDDSFMNVAFSDDGKRFVTADYGSKPLLRIWDAQSARQIAAMSAPAKVMNLALSPDGRYLAGRFNEETIVWDIDKQQQRETLHGQARFSNGGLIFSPNGKQLAIHGLNGLRIWDWDARQIQTQPATLTLAKINKQSGVVGIAPAAFSSDLTRIAGAYGNDVTVCDLVDGHEIAALTGHKNRVWCVAFSPDGRRVASGDGVQFSPWDTRIEPSPGEIKVWDAQSGKELRTLRGHQSSLQKIAFSPDGKRLASISVDRNLKVWNIEDGQQVFSITPTERPAGPSLSVAYSPDAKRLVVEGKIIDATTGQELLARTGAFTQSLTFSPDGKRLANFAGPSVNVRDSESGQSLFSLRGGAGRRATGMPVTGGAFSPDGKRLVTAEERKLKLWDAETGAELLSIKYDRDAWLVAFSSDSHKLAAVSGSSAEVTIYDATPLPEKPSP